MKKIEKLRKAWRENLREGMLVYWRNPAGKTSGLYTVWFTHNADNDEIDEDTVVLIANEVSEAEVTVSELRPVYSR